MTNNFRNVARPSTDARKSWIVNRNFPPASFLRNESVVEWRGRAGWAGATNINQDSTRRHMKWKHTILGAVALAVAAGFVASAFADEDNDQDKGKEAKLEAKAKVSKADAEKIALTKVPDGTLKECEIEKEKGKLIWSFCFTTPDTTDITEVNINAITGKPVSIEWESASDEANENDGEVKSGKEKGEDEDGKKGKDDDKD